ncbi:YdcF family protein [Gymnodinialimonas sp. 2305UL16-5]|uniref:YdcF family protein n=1 Tax=Gymnodinialimonas mytili TaxID=3126503 RepID=UPI0030B51FA8
MKVEDAARVLWDFHCVYDELSKSDVIIGLGSYDIRVAEHCAKLFVEGFSDLIIFTGSSGNWTRDLFPQGEAVAFKEKAVEHEVPKEAILLEPNATNIGENVQLSAAIVPNAKSAIFVTKPQTQRRCKATAEKQWSDVKAIVTAPHTKFIDQPLAHHNERALICEMVGDLERMNSYAQLGYQTAVDIPDITWKAFEVLVKAGFVDHLQKPTFSSQ